MAGAVKKAGAARLESERGMDTRKAFGLTQQVD